MLVTAVLGLIVSITFLVNNERHSRLNTFRQLQQDGTDSLRHAEGLLVDINREINRTLYIRASDDLGEELGKIRDEQIDDWSAARTLLEARILGYRELLAELEKVNPFWAPDLDQGKMTLMRGTDADKRLAEQVEKDKKRLQDLQSLRRARISSVSEDAIVIDKGYMHAQQRSFRKVGDRWLEYPEYAPGNHFTFRETSRDDKYVHLEDPSRSRGGDPTYPMRVRLPISGGTAQWSYEESAWFDLFAIEPIDE